MEFQISDFRFKIGTALRWLTTSASPIHRPQSEILNLKS
jgi:hypothetical protein